MYYETYSYLSFCYTTSKSEGNNQFLLKVYVLFLLGKYGAYQYAIFTTVRFGDHNKCQEIQKVRTN